VKATHDFGKRQDNILLNALSFINEVTSGETYDEKLPHEEKGVDDGFHCRLIDEQKEMPEVKELLS